MTLSADDLDRLEHDALLAHVSAMLDAYPLFDVPRAEWVAACRALLAEIREGRQARSHRFVVPEPEGPRPALEMDGNGYPTEETLQAIRCWPYNHLAELLDQVAAIWHWGYGLGELSEAERGFVRAEPDERFLRLATGGWSGNEDIIAAMRSNVFVRHLWRMSASGGLHIYAYPRSATESR